MLEVSVAVNVTKMEEFRKIIQKLKKALEEAKTHNYDVARRLISEVISMATTQGKQVRRNPQGNRFNLKFCLSKWYRYSCAYPANFPK